MPLIACVSVTYCQITNCPKLSDLKHGFAHDFAVGAGLICSFMQFQSSRGFLGLMAHNGLSHLSGI